MAFDPTTATSIQQQSSFDPGTAKSVEGTFDPDSAKPYQGSGMTGAQNFGLGVRNVLEGVGGIADLVDNPINTIINKTFGTHIPTGAAGGSLADALGLPKPQTDTQRVLGSGIAGATAGLTGSGVARTLAKAPGVLGAVMKTVASSPLMDTTSGATSGVSQQGAAEAGVGPWGQLAAGTLGGLAPTAGHIAAHLAGSNISTPKFVSDLFTQRGVDTTPANDPRTNPLSNRGMSPEDLATYHHVLATGTEEDINNHFVQSKMPHPDPAAVKEWVDRRNAVTNNIAPPDYADEMFHPVSDETMNFEAHRQNVQDHIDAQTENWSNKPDYEVLHSLEHPDGKDPNTLGSYDPETKKVRIFADRVNDPETLNALLYHDSLGHHGLTTAFGSNLDSTINTLLDRNVGQFSKDVDAWQKSNPNEYGGDRTRAAEEVLAQQSEKGQIKSSVSDAIIATIKRFGRKMGLDLGYSDAEVRNILAMAHDAVINGKSVRDNGFSKGPVQPLNLDGDNKFMKRPNATEPKDINDALYEDLAKGYTPRYRSWEEAHQAALDRGINPGNVQDIRSVGDLDKRLFQYDNNAHALNTELNSYAAKLNTGEELTGEESARAIEAIAEAQYVRGRIDNDASQVGRGLNAMKAIQFSRGNLLKMAEALKESDSGLEGLSDPDTLNRFLKQYAGLTQSNNPKGAATMIKQLNAPNWEDYIITLHNNMMLSGLSTHVKAPQDMIIGIGRELLESMTALPISAGKEALRALGADIKPGIHPAEVAGRLWGVMKAGMDADTYHNTVTTFLSKGVNPVNIGGKHNARIPGISMVTDLISAQDAFFRAFATNMHLYGLAARDAVNSARLNKTPMDWDTLMNDMSNRATTPSKDLLDGAKDAANQTLLLNKNAATAYIDRFKNTAKENDPLHRAVAFIANYLTPFIRVEANSLWNRTIRRSPLAFLDKQTMADLKGGGAAADIAMSRIAMGTAGIAATWMAGNQLKGPLSTWAAQLTGNKQLTGAGPDSPSKRAALEATGWRPDSVQENGQFNTGNKLAMSLNPFDQHNSTATMVHDLHEAYDKGANEGQVALGVKLALLSSVKMLADDSYLNDISPALDVFTHADNESKTAKFLSSEAATMMPNFTGQIARVRDQGQPMTQVPGNMHQSILNSMQADIPGLRGQLPKQMDPFGEPKQSGASMMGQHGIFSPGNHVDETTDPAKQEIARLDSITNQPMVSPAKRSDVKGVDPKTITNAKMEEYQQLAGQNIVNNVRQAMSNPEWEQMSDLEKAHAVQKISRDTKKLARGQVFGSAQ